MDISKLPKLSRTAENQPPAIPAETLGEDVLPVEVARVEAEATARVTYYSAASAIGWAEAWISIGLGVLLLFIFPNTIRYVHSPTLFEQNFPVTDAQGTTIPYPKSVFFWTDLGVTVFAGALVLEGIALAAARKVGPLIAAFAVTVGAVIFNVIVIVHVQPITGFPLFCGVGVVVLVYMALTQWRLIQALRVRDGQS